jgi:hypothetical protein
MFARIGIMRAFNRHVERVFDLSRKDPHWGRRKLARDRLAATRIITIYDKLEKGLSAPRFKLHLDKPRETFSVFNRICTWRKYFS